MRKIYRIYNAKTGAMESFTLAQVAKQSGIKYTTLQSRLKAGLTIEEALHKRIREDRKRPERREIWVSGERLSLREAATRLGIHYQTLYARLFSYYLKVDEAINRPIKK